MPTKIKKGVMIIILLALISQPIIVAADLPGAIVFLQSQAADPWITQAEIAAGVTNAPLNHLASVTGNLATDYTKTILALAAAGVNPATFGNIDYVVKLKTYFANNQMGDSSLLNDDAWSILALASVGEVNAPEVVSAKNYLLASQNADGGWGYSVGGSSDTNDTAAIIMALTESGVSASSSAISNAITYLQSAQNNDGGFGWTAGSNSDAGSDAWIISALYKVGQDPAGWNKNGNNPISHLQSLQDSDGGFWWMAPGTAEYNNKAMTAFAVIALAGKSFPVGYYHPANSQTPGTFYLRIEGKDNTICAAYVAGNTALEVVKNAATVCNFTYEIANMAYGPYLQRINNEIAAGMAGWMYFVNAHSPLVGAADYILQAGDEVLWYYGDWGWQPTRLKASKHSLSSGEALNVDVEYFNGQSWQGLAGASIKGASQEYTTASSGQAVINLPDGYYKLFAEKAGFVRSNQEVILAGSGVSQDVNLSVEVGQTVVGGESIIFTVTPSQLDFGKMTPGETKSQALKLANSGSVNLAITAMVSGDTLFTNNMKIDGGPWSDYNNDLTIGANKNADISLAIPNNYLAAGVKTGELILWAQVK